MFGLVGEKLLFRFRLV